MKVLVSTRKTQGFRKNDFCFVPEGELVMPDFAGDICGETDGECGCGRALSGVLTRKATTTFVVVESLMSLGNYMQTLYDSHHKAYGSFLFPSDTIRAAEWGAEILKVASQYEFGT